MKQFSRPTTPLLLVHALRYVLPAAAVGLAGCGQQTYEQRLQESAKFFAYVQKVDSSVGPPWKNSPANPGPIDQIRVPLQFKEVKKPLPVKNPETGELMDPEIDPRQPDYVALELPGLVATWEAPCRVTVDGKAEIRKGYLYVLTNAYMFANADQSGRAPDFVKDLLTLMADKLSLTPPDPAKDAQKEQYPRAQPFYVAQKSYDVFRLPDAFVKDGATYTIELYVQHAGPVEGVVMFALPAGLDSGEKLTERIPYLLETLKVSSKPPAALPKKGTAAPSKPLGGF